MLSTLKMCYVLNITSVVNKKTARCSKANIYSFEIALRLEKFSRDLGAMTFMVTQ